jgi:hypothetical protein
VMGAAPIWRRARWQVNSHSIVTQDARKLSSAGGWRSRRERADGPWLALQTGEPLDIEEEVAGVGRGRRSGTHVTLGLSSGSHRMSCQSS